MVFVGSFAECAVLLRSRAKRRKKFWVRPLVRQRLVKGQLHRLHEDLRMRPKRLFGYFRMSCSSFGELWFIKTPSITYQIL
jgi:hypothetical protein